MASLKNILADYDALILDLWGVIHDGTTLYTGVAETLNWLAENNKQVVFLSNAPRVAAKAQETLDRLGVPRAHYKAIVTSGQVAHDWLRDARPFGTHYYYLGPGKDEDIIADLAAYQRMDRPEECDFILCTGYEYDFQPHGDVIPLLDTLRGFKLPMLCVNPDLEVVKQDGTVQLCAGAAAVEYEARGGEVVSIGKPYPHVYEVCRKLLSGRMLAVGDNPDTDIKGANETGIDGLLITGGILKRSLASVEEARAHCAERSITPKFILPTFAF